MKLKQLERLVSITASLVITHAEKQPITSDTSIVYKDIYISMLFEKSFAGLFDGSLISYVKSKGFS